MSLAALEFGNSYACATTTEDDPDGYDRGGFHQVKLSVGVNGDTLTATQEVTDNYVERFEEVPDHDLHNKDDAVSWLLRVAKEHRQAADALEKLAEKAKATTEFVLVVPEEDEEDEEDDGEE